MSLAEVTTSFTESVASDLQEIRLWYAEQGIADVGGRLVAEILQRVEALGKYPELGRIVPGFESPFLRELIQPPFRIVYRYEPGKVYIVRI